MLCLVTIQMLLISSTKEMSFVENNDNLKWSQRIMSSTTSDISWYSLEYDGIEMIFSCCGFLKVPLTGTRCCINYNLALAP